MKKYFKQLKVNKKGFTLIEMIVVIAIIGILAAILVPSMVGYLETAKESREEANAKMVYTAAQAAVTSLEATNPVAGTGTGTVYAENATEGCDATRKDLFGKIEKFIGESNYGNFTPIQVRVVDGAVTEVKVTDSSGTATYYPQRPTPSSTDGAEVGI